MAVRTMDILCCKITIGDPDPSNPMVILNQIVLNEVLNLEISESYKQLIGTAKITFPKGTVYKSTIIDNVTLDGKSATSVTTEIMQDGVVIEKRSSQKAIDENTFKVGQRVNIKLGYNDVLKNMFDGYIAGYTSDSIVEINCENMAYKLKLKQSPKFETPSKGVTINDICGDKYKLLDGTGFKLHSDTRDSNIQIGKIKVTDNFTVADILNEWSKYGVFCFLKYDETEPSMMPAIAIGRPYSNSAKDKTSLTQESTKPFQINFREHVASNDLKTTKTNPKFLAVTGKALGSDQKFFEVTVRLNPDYDSSKNGSKEFQVVNATQINKKTHKVTGNTTAEGATTKTKVDLDTYTIVPYMSTKIGITSDQLVEEAIAYFKNYNLNGIEGTITIFGDYGMPAACQVEFVDDRNTAKNGLYLVEEVTTTFGVDGYRQKLKTPYKITGKQTYG